MGIGFALSGAIGGLGRGILADAGAKAAAAASELEERRLLAREAFKASLAEGNEAKKTQATRETNALTSNQRREELRLEYGLKDVNDARTNNRKTSSTIAIDKAKAGNDAALERLKSKLDVSEAAAASARELNEDMIKAGRQVGEYRVAADGSLAAFSKTGGLLGQTKKGVFLPDGRAPEAPIGLANTRGALPPPKQSASAPAPARERLKPKSDVKVLSPADVTSMYAVASQRAASGDLQWAGMTAAQIKAKVDAGLRSAGYKLGN